MTVAVTSSIKAIDGQSVHKITSGQVVVDLQTAVKELVENSLDAGATNIDVRFRDFGLKTIEVVDNGSGIAPDDYESIGLKHHTSKLASFEGLTSVVTFGFRGEAISSLCAMSESVTVTTAIASEAPMGTVIELDRSGRVVSKDAKVARQRGTTFTISGLFKPLAVRRKEFERNAKRDFAKALNLLNAYALVPCAKENRGVRLTVSNQEGGKKNVALRTDGSPSTRASVSALWGPKSLEHLVELDLTFNVETEKSILRRQGVKDKSSELSKNTIQVTGLISKFALGCGRTGTDRQFFFINGRPCVPSKVQKAFNEVYRSFNINQSPFIIADFIIPADSCDINVSPDKRTILLHSEGNLINALKASLEESFSTSRSTYNVGETNRSSRTKSGQSQPTNEDLTTSAQEGHDSSDSVTEPEAAIERGKSQSYTSKKTSLQPSTITQSPEQPNRKEIPLFVPSRSPSPTNNTSHLYSQNMPTSSPLPTPPLCAANSSSQSQSSHLLSELENSPFIRRSPLLRPTEPSALIAVHDDHDDEDNNDTSLPEPPRKGSIRSEGENLKRKERPKQMVLDTSGAAWNLRLDKSDIRPLKKVRVSEEDVGRESSAGLRETREEKKTERARTRSGLWGFAMPGTQIIATQARNSTPASEDEDLCAESGGIQSDGEPLAPEIAVKDEDMSQAEEIDELVSDAGGAASTPTKEDTPMEIDEERKKSPSPDVTLLSSSTPPESTHWAGEVEIIDPSNSEDLQEEDMLIGEHFRKNWGDGTAWQFNLEEMTKTWTKHAQHAKTGNSDEVDADQPLQAVTYVDDEAGLANANDETAIKALSRVIEKEDFNSMGVVGQFNKGFIIARRLRQQSTIEVDDAEDLDDLFIVDQHAADEKYNFEHLQQTIKLEAQKLVQPQPLQLSAAEEILAIDNIDILRQNGFDIAIHDEEDRDPSVPRLTLVGRPINKSTVFDMKDLEELLHLMEDLPVGQMVRCSKTRAMLAMRACRKSIMVGKPLTKKLMTTVVRHMSSMDQPWNCPHGRPTMRHLCDLSCVPSRSIPRIDWDVFSLPSAPMFTYKSRRSAAPAEKGEFHLGA